MSIICRASFFRRTFFHALGRSDGKSGLYFGRILLGRHIERPGHRFASSSHCRLHAQPISLEAAVQLRGAVDHLDHGDRLVTRDTNLRGFARVSDNTSRGIIKPPQSAVAFVVVKPPASGIANESRGAVDFLAVAITFDHHPPHFGVIFPVDTPDRDQIRSYDDEWRYPCAMP